MTIIYKPSEVISKLGIKDSVYKKYITALENGGYVFQKNQQGHRLFTDEDIETLQNFMEMIKYDGMTIEKVAKKIGETKGHVVITEPKQDSYDVMTLLEKQESKHHAVMTEIHKQNGELKEQLSLTQDHIKRLEEKHDRLFMQSIRESQEAKKIMIEVQESIKQIAATKEEKKKGFFARLFGK